MKGSHKAIAQTWPRGLWILCIGILAISACTQWTEEQKKRQSLPDFHFENLDGGELQRSDLPPGKPATILFLDPDCSHCKQTIESIVQHIGAFADNTLVIVSPSDRTRVIPYLLEKGLLGRPGVLVGTCTAQQFLDTFGTTQTPTTLFYGADFDLKRAYKGPVDEEGVIEGLRAARE